MEHTTGKALLMNVNGKTAHTHTYTLLVSELVCVRASVESRKLLSIHDASRIASTQFWFAQRGKDENVDPIKMNRDKFINIFVENLCSFQCDAHTRSCVTFTFSGFLLLHVARHDTYCNNCTKYICSHEFFTTDTFSQLLLLLLLCFLLVWRHSSVHLSYFIWVIVLSLPSPLVLRDLSPLTKG